ncbi:hypothetical protein [Bacilliculturomica massiliensis]|uniref:hypothetical protein n=1 Tax=Bacilliculturomica massiliensis TaxID=1917867 RepID=UPI0010316FDD|nr:hypothetical protein [Bacilliculturomica massiliensis]
MMEHEIQSIVKEVIRRMGLAGAGKKILVLAGPSADEEAVQRHLRETEKGPYTIDRIWMNGEGQIDGSLFNIQSLMEEHCALLAAGLTLKQLMNIHGLQMEDPAAELVAEALRMGKPVSVLSKWLNTRSAAPAFVRRINEIKKDLSTYGIAFVDERENKKDGRCLDQNRIDKRVIAKQDLKNVHSGELAIREDAVVTTTAKDLLDKRGIKVVRCQNQ